MLHRRSSFVDENTLHMVVDYDDLENFSTDFEAFLEEKAIPAPQIESYYSLHGCGHFD